MEMICAGIFSVLGSDFEPVLCIDEKPGTKGPNSKRIQIKVLYCQIQFCDMLSSVA